MSTILPCPQTANQNRLDEIDSVRARLNHDAGCPAWCIIESPSDNGVIHYSDVSEVVPTAGGLGERRPIQVNVEQLHRDGAAPDPAQIVMNHAGFWVDPLTPDEALHLAGLLILAARRAMTTVDTTAADPHVLCASQHADDECPRRRAVIECRAASGITTTGWYRAVAS